MTSWSVRLDVAAMEVVPPRLKVEAVVTTPTTPSLEPRMDIHQNARTTMHSRMLIVQRLGLWLVRHNDRGSLGCHAQNGMQVARQTCRRRCRPGLADRSVERRTIAPPG